MNVSSLVLAIVYLALSLIPVLYNHYASRNISSSRGGGAGDLSTYRESTALNTVLPRSLIVFINNLSDEQLKSFATAIESALRKRGGGSEGSSEAEVRYKHS